MQIPITLRSTIVDLFGPDDSQTGLLTDEHTSNSYGIPVVLIDGRPMGVAEIPPNHEIFVHYTYRPSDQPALYETNEQIRARRDPAQVAMVAQAQHAGYPIAEGA